jgi:uncharacterized cofD-like protein
MKNKKPVITLIGGTGASVIGRELKKSDRIKVNLIVSLIDDGGSTGRLMKIFKIPPVGDIRKALSSLSTLDPTITKSFEYRFLNQEFNGHTLGNLLLTSLIKNSKDLNQAVKLAEKIFQTKGGVYPTTLEPTCLITKYSSGKIIKGENNLDENRNTSLGVPVKYSIKNQKKSNPRTLKLLSRSDIIVFGPGDLGANVIGPILSNKIRKTIKESKAKIVYIANLMTKLGETHEFKVNDCLNFLEKRLEKKVDYLILNNTPIPQKVLKIYEKQKEYPMSYDLEKLKKGRKVIEADLINETLYQKSKADKLRRSFLRHDSEKTAKIFLEKII